MALNTDFRPADSDNNLLRKILTRLNAGLTVAGVSIDTVLVSNPLDVKQVGGDTWAVSVASPVSVTPTGTVPVAVTAPIASAPGGDALRVLLVNAIDAFSRQKVAGPEYVFDSQMTYNIPALVYESITAQSGATVAHDSTNRCALMTFAATPTGGKAQLQTFEHFRYQPGRALEIIISFCFESAVANCTKFVGYSDGTNGVELQQVGTTVQLALLSGTDSGNQTAAQATWNIDKMDGTGISGLTLDLTKTQLLVIDMQALYTGRVRVGFDTGGEVIPVHEFNHANVNTKPYIQTANLPLRAGMTCTGTVSTTMRFMCASIVSYGGQEDVPGYSFTVEGTGTAGSGTAAHILSVRPKTTFNSIPARGKFVLDSIEVVVTGNNPVSWQLVLGQAISGTTTFSDVNTTYSMFEFNTAGTISGSPGVVLLGGYVASGATQKQATSSKFNNKYPIALDAAGVVRALGTLSVIATGLGGVSATRVTMNWREIR